MKQNKQLITQLNSAVVFYYLFKVINTYKLPLHLFYNLYTSILLFKKRAYLLNYKGINWTYSRKVLNLLNFTPHKTKAYPFLILAAKFTSSRKHFRRFRLASIRKISKRLRKRWKATRVNFIKRGYVHKPNIYKFVNAFGLKQRIFMNKKTIVGTIWAFLYTKVKNNFLKKQLRKQQPYHARRKINKKKRILLNVYRPLVWKLRKARYAHWSLRTLGKLNEYRYDKLLGVELTFVAKTPSYQFLAHILLNTMYCVLSWRQMLLLSHYNLIVYNGEYAKLPNFIQKGDIIELPFGKKLKKLRKKLKLTFNMIVSKSKKLSYRSFLSRKKKYRFMRRHTEVPKIFKKLPLGLKRLGSCVAYEPSLNILAIIYNIPFNRFDVNLAVGKTSVLSLQNWRYRFD